VLRESQQAARTKLQEHAEQTAALEASIAALETEGQAEVERIKLAQARLVDLNTAREKVEQERARLSGEERRLNDELEALQADEIKQHERMAAVEAQLAAEKETHDGVVASVAELTSNEQQLNAAIEELRAKEQNIRARHN